MVTGVLFGSMFLLMLMDVPIVFAMGVAAAAGLLMLPHVGLEAIAQRMFFGLEFVVILAVPLFLFLGELMEAAKITDLWPNSPRPWSTFARGDGTRGDRPT